MHYYILIGEERKGPYTISQVISMWNSGVVRAKLSLG